MQRFAITSAFVALGLVLLLAAGCGKEKTPRYTSVPVTGYPYPFGIDSPQLLGKEKWDMESTCPGYRIYWLRNPPVSSRWSEYSSVSVTADSAGTLQGFGAARSFSSNSEAQTDLHNMLVEIRRRFGTPTDSSVVNGMVRREWQDASGSLIEVYDRTARGGWVLQSVSAKLKKHCGMLSI